MKKTTALLDEDSRTALYFEQERQKEEARELAAPTIARQKLIEPYTDGLPYNRERVVEKAKSYLYRAFESTIECGKMMIWIREEEGVQTFAHLLNQFFPNVARRTAYNFMRLARVAVEHPKMQGLIEKQRSKALALLEILDEEDLTDFDETESIAGMEIDEIEKMPARQLKNELRTYKQKIERGQEQLRAAEDKTKALEEEIRNLKAPKLYSTEEEKYLAAVEDIGWKFERILVEIRSSLPYDRQELPQIALKKLFYLLMFISKEALEERLHLCNFYEGAADGPWDPNPQMELPSEAEIYENLPHLKNLLNTLKKSALKRQSGKKDGENGSVGTGDEPRL